MQNSSKFSLFSSDDNFPFFLEPHKFDVKVVWVAELFSKNYAVLLEKHQLLGWQKLAAIFT
jgi:hypothetical protein